VKDKTEKLFVSCADVFAELVNGLLYGGRAVLKKETLLPGPTESIYPGKAEGLGNQFQDYSMYVIEEKDVKKVSALYTLENQSRVDTRMPLRQAAYEGAAYRRQYKRRRGQGIYPVVSIVLNWGEKPWKAAKTIGELMDYPIPKGAEDYIDRNRLHVFDMRFLEKEVRERFEGDVRIVLDYLSDRESLLRRRQKPENPEEVMRMLHALSGDERYLEYIAFVEEDGGKSMCELLDEMENKGRREGKREGRKEGRREGIQAVISICQELGLTFDVTRNKLMEKFSLGDEEARRNMTLYW